MDARDQAQNTPLIDASKIGCVHNVEILLDRGADIHAVNKIGFSPLLVAIHYHSHDVVEFLLQPGADYRSSIPFSQTILHFLAALADETTLEIFTQLGLEDFDINARDVMGRTADEIAEERRNRKPDEWGEAFDKFWKSVNQPRETAEVSYDS